MEDAEPKVPSAVATFIRLETTRNAETKQWANVDSYPRIGCIKNQKFVQMDGKRGKAQEIVDYIFECCKN